MLDRSLTRWFLQIVGRVVRITDVLTGLGALLCA